MPRKSFDQIAATNVKRLIAYADNNLELSDADAIFAENSLLHAFGIVEPSTDDIGKFELYAVLDELFDYALKKRLYEQDERLLFEGYIMGQLMPRPSAVIDRFDNIARFEGPMTAAKWLQKLESDATYLRRPDLDKNIRWVHEVQTGNIIVTINLAKPEKTPEEIERAKAAKTGYPKCPLCYENVGFYGNAAQAAREHIRVIPIELDGEDWFMQFSPYEYFDEHLIAVSRVHRPMHVDKSAFRRMLDFVELFPEYFIGSNAPLPIVGGSILAHDHYQGGKKVLPVFERPARKHFISQAFPSVNIAVVDWYNTVIRFESKDREKLVEATERVRSAWDNYSDEGCNIISNTGEQHNTVTPIAYMNADGEFAIDLILRNNRTDESHPYGIFHPTADMHNIKKESIGIIEAMGLFILPGRLAGECEQIKDLLTGKTKLDFAALADEKNVLHKHLGMIAQLAADIGTSSPEGKATRAITNFVNDTCEKILSCTAVFKNTEDGQSALEKFLKSVL